MASTSSAAKVRQHFVLASQLLGAAAIEQFRDEAMALTGDQIEGFNCDPAVMMSNVRIGVESVLPHMNELLAARPRTQVPWILSIVNLGHAVEYAVANCASAPRVTRAELDTKYAELQQYREPALLIARALAFPLFQKLSEGEVATIEAGKGYYDHGQDGVSLASLFRREAAQIAGLHPFTPEHLDTMERLGAWVASHVTPEGARPKPRATVGVSPELRDRLWTLLKLRHAELRKAGMELFGEDALDERVPRLNSRARTVVQNDNSDDPVTPTPTPPVA